jgi:hypothetical protein
MALCMLYLSDICGELPDTERRRLERRLGVLLRHPERKAEICRSIVEKIRTEKGRAHCRPESCDWFAISIEKGDPVSITDLRPDEREILECSPMIQLNGQFYMPAEFLEAWKADFPPTSQPFLFQALHRLSLAEKRAFIVWLKRHTDSEELAHLPFQSVGMRLYLLIRQLQRVWIEPPESASPEGEGPWRLDDIFGELWHKPPLYWYQREVLPFYQCLQDLEKELTRRHRKLPSSFPLIQHVYHGLRTGSYCLVEQNQGYGQKLLPLLYRTRDFPVNPTTIIMKRSSRQEDRLF